MCKKALDHILNMCLFSYVTLFYKKKKKSNILPKLLAFLWRPRPIKALVLMIEFYIFLEEQWNFEDTFSATGFRFCKLSKFCL